jgi:hypothetical protein
MIPNAKMPENAPEREAAEKNIAILRNNEQCDFQLEGILPRLESLSRIEHG